MSEAFHTFSASPTTTNRTFLRHLFRKAQMAVDDVSSEAELLEKARSRPDLVVLGSRWVSPSAPELCRRLKDPGGNPALDGRLSDRGAEPSSTRSIDSDRRDPEPPRRPGQDSPPAHPDREEPAPERPPARLLEKALRPDRAGRWACWMVQEPSFWEIGHSGKFWEAPSRSGSRKKDRGRVRTSGLRRGRNGRFPGPYGSGGGRCWNGAGATAGIGSRWIRCPTQGRRSRSCSF